MYSLHIDRSFLNNGDGSFSEIAWMAGVAASEWTWSTKFADIDLDDEDFDPRTRREKQKALLQEQRALVKLYNDKKKLLNPPRVPKILKRPKKTPTVNTSIVTNPYQFMPVTLNPFDLPASMQKRPE